MTRSIYPVFRTRRGAALRRRARAPCQSLPDAPTQRGVALIVALILLVVVTLVGLVSISGTIMQNKMAANQYDRETAFQSAESALEVVERQLQTPGASVPIARDCRAVSVFCEANPFTDPSFAGSASTLPTGSFTVAALATGQPQYIVENMGIWINNSQNIGQSQNIACKQKGVQCPRSQATYYRITVRSGDPATIGNRAIVTLQSVIAI